MYPSFFWDSEVKFKIASKGVSFEINFSAGKTALPT